MTALGVRPAPGCGDYLAAIQSPQRCFTVPLLQNAVPATDALGLPVVASGASAVVFKAMVGNGSEALRCYTNMAASNRERYESLGRHLQQWGPAAVARAEWLDDAIVVHGESWPVLRMEWVSGRSLDRYVDFLVRERDTASLMALSAAWLELSNELVAANFAHGDLQHGNVLIDQTGGLRLVDLDGVWIPELAAFPPPTETGHPNYQHPARRFTRCWDARVDTFSALAIYLSLRAVAADPNIWHELHDDEQLIFSSADFDQPGRTRAWDRLAGLHDPEIRRLSSLLAQACEPTWLPSLTLAELVAGRVRPAVNGWPPFAAGAKVEVTGLLWPINPATHASHGVSVVGTIGDELLWPYAVANGRVPSAAGQVHGPAPGALRPPESLAADLRQQAAAAPKRNTPTPPPSVAWWPRRPGSVTAAQKNTSRSPNPVTSISPRAAARDLALMGQWGALAMLGVVGTILLAVLHAATDPNSPASALVDLVLGPVVFLLIVSLFGLLLVFGRFLLRLLRRAP